MPRIVFSDHKPSTSPRSPAQSNGKKPNANAHKQGSKFKHPGQPNGKRHHQTNGHVNGNGFTNGVKRKAYVDLDSDDDNDHARSPTKKARMSNGLGKGVPSGPSLQDQRRQLPIWSGVLRR